MGTAAFCCRSFLKEMGIKFLSLSSGSSGNCYYIGTDEEGFLIDAGISARKIKKSLAEHNIDMAMIKGVCISHDHADHIAAAGYLGERMGKPIFVTKTTLEGMNRNWRMTEKIYTAHRFIFKEISFALAGFEITPFEVPHDGHDNVGFLIKRDNWCMAFATDLGRITPTVKRFVSRAKHLVIESNYDAEMLRNGKYSYFLKRRILGENGHLCNNVCANFLADNYTECGWKNIFLCHLSNENNTPELALSTTTDALLKAGVKVGEVVNVHALKRDKASQLFILD